MNAAALEDASLPGLFGFVAQTSTVALSQVLHFGGSVQA
jgi:hypothetical protein